MKSSMPILASAYAGSSVAADADSHSHHDSYSAAIAPDRLGGAFEFSDATGGATTAGDFTGHWTLLFFGYSRCRASCPGAIRTIARASEELRDQGLDVRAVFVDIDAPPLGMVRRGGSITLGAAAHNHAEMNRLAALRAVSSTYDGKVRVLSGTRGQLASAARAFMVAREHIPPRQGEEGHSINHSSRIYLIAPDRSVVAYAYHDSEPAMLVNTVARLDEHRKRST